MDPFPSLESIPLKPEIVNRIFSRRKTTIRIRDLIVHEWFHIFSENINETVDKDLGSLFEDAILNFEKESPMKAEILILKLRYELKKLANTSQKDRIKCLDETIRSVNSYKDESMGMFQSFLNWFRSQENLSNRKLDTFWNNVETAYNIPPSIDEVDDIVGDKDETTPTTLRNIRFTLDEFEVKQEVKKEEDEETEYDAR